MPYTAKQKKLARIAPPRNKITKADFDVLNRARKGKEKEETSIRILLWPKKLCLLLSVFCNSQEGNAEKV